MGLLLLLVVGVALAAGAAAATAALRHEHLVDDVVTFGLVLSAAVVLTAGVPGALGALDRPVVAGVALATGAAATLVWWTPLRRRIRADAEVASAVVRAVRADLWVALLSIGALVSLAWQAFVGAVLPVYAYDGLTYHLTTVATWVQSGDLEPTRLSLCCSRFPLNGELLSAWPTVMTGDDRAVGLVQVGFVLLGAAAVAGIARTARLPAHAAVAAGALFVLTPVVLAQAPTPYLDVVIAALALAGLHAALRFVRTGRIAHAVGAGLAAGLVSGTKGTGLLWAVAIGLITVAGVVVAVRRDGPPARRRGAAALLTAGVLVVLLGSFWYVRNWVDTDNPFYPWKIEVAGQVLFDGPISLDTATDPSTPIDAPWPEVVARSWGSDLAFWNNGIVSYDERLGGLGPLWAYLGAPLGVVVAVVLLRRRELAGVAFVAVGVVFLLQPYRWWARFTLPLAALGAVAVVAVACWLGSRRAGRALRGAALVLAAIGAGTVVRGVDPAAHGTQLSITDVLDLAASPASERTLGRVFLDEYEFVDRMPDDAEVVADLRASAFRFVYPLFGDDLGNRVRPWETGSRLRGAWVVTEEGRPADDRVRAAGEHELVSERRGLRAWRPLA